MSGCFLFLQRLANGKRRGDRLPASPRDSLGGYASSLECGLSSCYSSGGMQMMQPLACAAASSCYHAGSGYAGAPPAGHHAASGSVVLCSPASSDSDCGYSSCTDSDGAPGYYCPRRRSPLGGTDSGSAASSGACTGGAPSPVSHLRSLGRAGEARHAAALQVRDGQREWRAGGLG